jgi:uncharacterized RDD family membrane protein YckC
MLGTTRLRNAPSGEMRDTLLTLLVLVLVPFCLVVVFLFAPLRMIRLEVERNHKSYGDRVLCCVLCCVFALLWFVFMMAYGDLYLYLATRSSGPLLD